MSRTLDYMIEVLQAAKAGKTIQCEPLHVYDADRTYWVDDPEPSWAWELFNYRVKPEPRRWTMHVASRGDLYSCYVDGYCHACTIGKKSITVQEVLE